MSQTVWCNVAKKTTRDQTHFVTCDLCLSSGFSAQTDSKISAWAVGLVCVMMVSAAAICYTHTHTQILLYLCGPSSTKHFTAPRPNLILIGLSGDSSKCPHFSQWMCATYKYIPTFKIDKINFIKNEFPFLDFYYFIFFEKNGFRPKVKKSTLSSHRLITEQNSNTHGKNHTVTQSYTRTHTHLQMLNSFNICPSQ